MMEIHSLFMIVLLVYLYIHYSASFGSYNKLGNTLKPSGYDSSNTILSTSNNGADICKNNPSLSLSSDSSTVAFSSVLFFSTTTSCIDL